ncbi:MAG: hypothetical protein C5B58_15990 [Acidobacteria bacterium]|nr:MAG: hypothetical protein C5B58_15990 [Acidobacteriota bacterium]
MSKSKISPEEAQRLEHQIDKFVSDVALGWNAAFGEKPTGFEQRLLQALSDRDADFFRILAEFCEVRTADWSHDTSGAEVARFLARQYKRELESKGRIPTRPSIRKLVELEWAALKSNIDSSKTELGQILGRSHFSGALKHEIKGKNAEQFRKCLNSKVFPDSVWKRVWKDPELSKVGKGKSGRPRK